MVHQNIRVLHWFNFFTDFKLYAPVAIIYFAKVSDSFTLGMSIFAIAMISSALFEIPTGVFSDKIGRRKTVMIGALCAVLYSIFYAVGQSYWYLVVGALFEGLSRSFYSGNNNALLHDTLTQMGNEHDYGEFLGRVSAMFQAALAASALLGGFMATWSFVLVMWFSVVPQVLCFLLSFRLIEPKVHTSDSGNIYQHLRSAMHHFMHNRKLRLLSSVSILSYGIGEAMYQFQSAFFGMLLPLWGIGLVKTFSSVGATLSFRYSGKILRRFGTMRFLVASNFYNRIINIVASAFPTVLSPFLMSSTSMLYGATSVAKSALMQKEFRSELRATMGSLDSFAGSLVFGLMALLLGFIGDKVSPAHAILVSQLLVFPTFWFYWKLIKEEKAIS